MAPHGVLCGADGTALVSERGRLAVARRKCACWIQEVVMAQEIGREQVRLLAEQGAQIVDVLPSREYGEDHLPGAINLPLRKIETEASKGLDATRAIVVYCADSA
jgi:3-mercaptopyruvate sulfurtransferase SseA